MREDAGSAAPAPVPVSRQARGEERRRDVLEATLRVIGRDGIRAATHRAVALEAGTSLSATTYYFESRDDMIAQAFTHYVAERLQRLRELAAETAADETPLTVASNLLVAYVLEELAGRHLRLVAEFEMAVESIHTQQIRAQYRRLTKRLEEYVAGLLTVAGSSDPQADARILLCFGRGLELDEITRSRRSGREAVSRLCRRFLEGLLHDAS
jgi:DNA-binding transcriptional regulator YbjK